MALFSRGGATAEAVYARSIDGEHLWLAVRGEAPLVLRGDGVDLEVPTEADDDLLTAVFPLGAALADHEDDVALRLVAGRRAAPVTAPPEAAPGPALVTPTSRDGRWQLAVETSDGAVLVRRNRVEPGVAALAFRATDAGVEVDLDTGETLTLGHQPDLAPGATTPVAGVVRSRNAMTRPNFAVALPPMLEPDVELRWLKDGRLAVHRKAAEVR